MTDERKAIDEAVEKFRALMEGQLERAKKLKKTKILLIMINLTKL